MNKIITGNCFTIINDVVNSVKNPVIVTDPPFNIGYHYEGYKDKLPEDIYYKTNGFIHPFNKTVTSEPLLEYTALNSEVFTTLSRLQHTVYVTP